MGLGITELFGLSMGLPIRDYLCLVSLESFGERSSSAPLPGSGLVPPPRGRCVHFSFWASRVCKIAGGVRAIASVEFGGILVLVVVVV